MLQDPRVVCDPATLVMPRGCSSPAFISRVFSFIFSSFCFYCAVFFCIVLFFIRKDRRGNFQLGYLLSFFAICNWYNYLDIAFPFGSFLILCLQHSLFVHILYCSFFFSSNSILGIEFIPYPIFISNYLLPHLLSSFPSHSRPLFSLPPIS